MRSHSELASYQDSMDSRSDAERDRQLVAATKAAIDVSLGILEAGEPQQPQPRRMDSNCSHSRRPDADSPPPGFNAVGRSQRQARKKPRSLRQKFSRLLAYVTGSGRSNDTSDRAQQTEQPLSQISNRHNRSDSAKKDTTTSATADETTRGRSSGSGRTIGGNGATADRRKRRGANSAVANASNTVSNEDAATKPKDAEAAGAAQRPQQDPPKEASKQQPKQQQQKVCVQRDNDTELGSFTTPFHRQVQESIFRECRVVPVDTLYKKVAMMPGRERLFLAAPRNPRTTGSRFLYDIAYENFRHHSDCNRDFTRTGLKKICPGYCQPSQFRYVY